MKKPILVTLLLILVTSITGGTWYFLRGNTTSAHDTTYYKNIWKDTFRYYQAATTRLPKKGKFDLSFTSMASGSGEALSRLGSVEFSEKFSSLSVEVLGEHDFENTEHPSINATMKVYLNKRAFGAGDIDITFRIDGSGSVDYSLNHIDGATLAFLGVPTETADSLVLSAEENQGRLQHSDSEAEFLREIIATIADKKKDSPLVENTADQEKQIIDAFLATDTIDVTSGEDLTDDTTRLSFRFNPDNCITFLNEVARILGGENASKTFDSDKEVLKAFAIAGTVDISNHRIEDSHILSEIPLSSIEEKTLEKKYEVITLENRFLYPNPEKFDIDWTSLVSSKSTPDNKIQFNFKWLIK